MAVTIDYLMGMMSGTASDSRQMANKTSSLADSALANAKAEDARQKAELAAKADRLKAEQDEQERLKRDMQNTPSMNRITSQVAPVDPVEQASLLQLMPKAQQDYANVFYQMIS